MLACSSSSLRTISGTKRRQCVATFVEGAPRWTPLKLSIPPFLGLHLVFNVDRLRPYFPPLLDTSDMAEQLTSTELNPDYMEQATTDRIMDTQIKNTCQ